MNKKVVQVTMSVTLGFFLLVLADLIPFWMPMGNIFALLLVTVLLMAWACIILVEQVSDEREVYLKMMAGRVAYLSGMAVLLTALLVQGLSETIDPWIPVALATMVVSKLLTRIYLE